MRKRMKPQSRRPQGVSGCGRAAKYPHRSCLSPPWRVNCHLILSMKTWGFPRRLYGIKHKGKIYAACNSSKATYDSPKSAASFHCSKFVLRCRTNIIFRLATIFQVLLLLLWSSHQIFVYQLVFVYLQQSTPPAPRLSTCIYHRRKPDKINIHCPDLRDSVLLVYLRTVPHFLHSTLDLGRPSFL